MFHVDILISFVNIETHHILIVNKLNNNQLRTINIILFVVYLNCTLSDLNSSYDIWTTLVQINYRICSARSIRNKTLKYNI